MHELCAILRATLFAGALVAAFSVVGNYAFQAVKYSAELSALSQLQVQTQMQKWVEKRQDEQLEKLLRRPSPRARGGI